MRSETSALALDIGSTIIKVAEIDWNGNLLRQSFRPRNYDVDIPAHVSEILSEYEPGCRLKLICSSANGGLRIGIITLTERFSGAELRNQVLSAGGNPVFVHTLDGALTGHLERVDVLLVGGGIDCADAWPMASRLDVLELSGYRYNSLLYAGNCYLAPAFKARFPEARIIDNPLSGGLACSSRSVYETLRNAYLEDLIYREGVTELQQLHNVDIRATPEVVNRGFERATINQSQLAIGGPCLLVDIGGATTDLHYTVDIIEDDSLERPSRGASVARYVFTDLGIAASEYSTSLLLKTHPRTHELLRRSMPGDGVTDVYRLLIEGEYQIPAEGLAYACLYLALERFVQGNGPGLPEADLSKLTQIVLTGGGAQTMTEEIAAAVVGLAMDSDHPPRVLIDRGYQIWVDGITWGADMGILARPPSEVQS